MKSLGSNIRYLRESNHLSQRELSEKLNVGTSTLSQYENNIRVPSDEIKIKIADYFNVTVDYLLGRANNPKLSHKEERDIQRELSQWREELDQGTLQMKLDGNEVDEEVKQFIIDSMEDTLTLARIKAKEKFTPNKYKKKK